MVKVRTAGKALVAVILFGLLAITAGEIYARYYLGLGTPPLYQTHPQIEYLHRAQQNVSRFGNHILINEYGMRSPSFPARRQGTEYRLMVFGDSVVNGLSHISHEDLATSELQVELTDSHGPTVVGNISASSWGPGNWLAYAREYGFFDADTVVLVISSHDYADVPIYQQLNPRSYPTTTPASALYEALTRYLPDYMPSLEPEAAAQPVETEQPVEIEEEQGAAAVNDLVAFLQLAKRDAKQVLVLQHWEKTEIEQGKPGRGYAVIKQTCAELGIRAVSLEPYFRTAMDEGREPYRDSIHPTPLGQQLIAEAILSNVAPAAGIR